MKRLLTLLVAALVGGCAGGGDGAAPVPRFEDVGAGEAFPIDGAAGFDTRRGYLIVHERAGDPASGEVRVPVAIVRARTPNGAPPVVFLQGGPGVGRLDAANYPTAYPWTTQRDFIVIGPRGTAHADPALPCPEYAEALVADAPGGLVAAATVCRRRYGEEGIDVASYHTAASARDMEDLRVALGIDAWSLYGLSYGTRLALTYARDYPDGVASMILDSPLPHGADYDAESPANFADALRRVASACAAVPACRAAYPDLYQRFSDAVAALKEEGAAADRVAQISLGAPRAVARAPLLMDALARGDAGPFGPSAAASSGTSRFTFAWGLRISVWCAEAFPFRDRADARAPLDTFAGLDGAVVPPDVCAAWGAPRRPGREVAPTVSSVPTLIIAGEFDPDTPPKWADVAAAGLSRSRTIVVPYGLHTETTRWGGDGCAMSIAAAFFDDEDAFLASPEASPDAPTACLAARTPPDFAVE